MDSASHHHRQSERNGLTLPTPHRFDVPSRPAVAPALSSPEFLHEIEAAILDHLPKLVDQCAGGIRVRRLSIGPPILIKSNRHHRLAQLTYEGGNGSRRLTIWLKFRPELETSFRHHWQAYETRGWHHPFLPRPYFFHRYREPAYCMVAMEHVTGSPLRWAMVRAWLRPDRNRMDQILRRIGEHLRSFHDALESSSETSVADLIERLRRAIDLCPDLRRHEQTMLAVNIDHAARIAGVELRLPVTRTHSDLAIRNIIIRSDSWPTVVDCDGMRHPEAAAWRDVAQFLLNLTSLVRFHPVLTHKLIARMSRAFASGYRGAGYPHGLSEEQANALIYLHKIERVLGCGFRNSYFVYYSGLTTRTYLRQLRHELIYDWSRRSDAT